MVREIASEDEGYIRLRANRFDVKSNGDVIAVLYDSEEEYKSSAAQPEQAQTDAADVNATAKAIALAKQLGVDIAAVCAAKKDGIVKTADVESFAASAKKAAPATPYKFTTATINVYDRERVLIIGGGQLSEQIIDIMLDDKDKYIAGVVDTYKTEYPSYNCPLFTCDILNFTDHVDKAYYDTAIVALGGTLKAMKHRREVYETLKAKGVKFTNAIGNNTNIRRAVGIGENNIIMHNCFIGTGAHIGNNNIISYGTCIGHHNNIGSHNLFAPSVSLAGNVNIGDSNIIMTGVNVISSANIGSNIVFPVGYNVMNDIPDGTNLVR